MFLSVNKSTLIDPERLRLNKWLQTKYQPNARSKIMELTISRTIGTRVGQKEGRIHGLSSRIRVGMGSDVRGTGSDAKRKKNEKKKKMQNSKK